MLKLQVYQRQAPTAATFSVEGESAELDELLKRLALGDMLKVAAVAPAVTPPGKVLTLTPAPAPPVAAVKPTPAAAAPAKAPPAKVEAEEDAEEEEEEEDDDASSSGMPPGVMDAVKVNGVIKALIAKDPKATIASLTEWCLKNQGRVQTLERLGDTLVERVQRAAQLLSIPTG